MRQVDTCSMKVNCWIKIFWASTEKKKAGVAIIISDNAKAKIDWLKEIGKVITS